MEASRISFGGGAVAGAGLVAVAVVLAALDRDSLAAVLATNWILGALTAAFRGNGDFALRAALRRTVVA